jgi:hypothetical protein
MSPEDKALYQRIATSGDATKVTLAERHHIELLSPPDEEDRVFKEKTGLTPAELKDKALTNSATFGETETSILIFGVNCDHFAHPPISTLTRWALLFS